MSDPAADAPDQGERKCGFDMTYLKSIHGILKAKQIVSIVAYANLHGFE